MSQKRDYYDVLGLSKNASAEDIKRAYKQLAKKYHPDINKEADAEDKFKEVLEAYTVLNDPQKKQQYDQYGFEGPQGFGGFDFNEYMRNSGAHFDFEDLFGSMGFGDLFGSAFGSAFGGARKRGPRRGQDLRFDLTLTLEEAAFGAEKSISYNRITACATCKGTGSADGKTERCKTCAGHGVVQHTRRTPFGTMATRTACPECKGTGETITKPCADCKGSKVVVERRKIKVNVPAGVDHGEFVRMHNEGNAGEQGGGTGDLYLAIHLKPHPVFRRDGADLFAEVPIGFAEAALGATVSVPTLDGKEAELNVPAGTQTDTLFKLKGLGISRGRGDLYIKTIVQTPEKLTKRQKELFEELAKSEGKKVRKGFFDKLKKGFG